MNKCVICAKDSGKGKTCGSTCRSKLARSVASTSVAEQTDKVSHRQSHAANARGFDVVGVLVGDVPKVSDVPANFGESDCECGICKSNRSTGGRHTFNHGPWKSVTELAAGELNRVAIPGDVDYKGVAC